ncbi:MAG: hypothetical protein HKN68_06610 [Saprospiraceae bacterium]|nr:hypothetical protein [Saprospiraceae bacterium]
MKKSFSNWHLWVIWLLFTVTAVIVFYRSAILSMTHDESATWIYLQDNTILPILFLKDAWGTANNHYLNSLLIQCFTAIIGDKEWVVRLPNTLSYLLYGFASIYLIKKVFITRGAQLMVAGFVFLNVYLIDFFSLARGYGMSISFHMCTLVFLYLWLKGRKPLHLIYLYAFLTLAALSLFTHLIFFPVYTLIILGYIFWSYRKRDIPFQSIEIFIPLASTFLILVLVYVPFTSLSSNAEFLWGTSMLEESFKGLIRDSLQAREYLGGETYGVLGVLLGSCVLLGIVFRHRSNKVDKTINNFHLGLFAVFILMIVVMILSKWMLGTLYPVERKSTLYLPLVFLLVPFSIDLLKNHRVTFFIGWIFFFLSLMHFQDKLEIDRTREWYYDYQTKDFIQSIASETNGEKVDVGMNWTFFWSAEYYLITGNHNHIQSFSYPDDPSDMPTHDYMIIHHEEFKLYENDYKILEGPNISQVSLLKKRQ